MKIKRLLVFLVLGIGSLSAWQADTTKQTDTTKQEKTAEAKPERPNPPQKVDVYRFHYTIAELNGKQRINERTFEILTTRRGEMKSGSRIPVVTGSLGDTSQFQYMDVGLNANMNFSTRAEEEIDLRIDVSMTSVVPSDGEASETAAKNAHLPPITRQTHIEADTEVKLGAPTVIGRIEDVGSAHSYELSVTVTRR